MADYFQSWSEFLPLDSSDKTEWLKSVLYLDQDTIEDGKPIQMYLEEKFGIEVSQDQAEYWPDFSFEFEDDGKGVVFYAKECGNLDNLVAVIRAYLVKFDPKGCFSISWGDTCSKPRAGEFGGGAVFITANSVEYMSTYDWVKSRTESHSLLNR